jgi:hypothetical protein
MKKVKQACQHQNQQNPSHPQIPFTALFYASFDIDLDGVAMNEHKSE